MTLGQDFELSVRAITPIWTGGMKTGSCSRSPKISGLIGGLRYWAHLANTRCSGCKPPKLCDVCWTFGTTGWAARFRLQVRGLVLESYSNDRAFPSALVPQDPEGNFQLCFRTRWGDVPRTRGVIEKALCLISSYGGLGARSQRGYGQVEYPCPTTPNSPGYFQQYQIDAYKDLPWRESIARIRRCLRSHASDEILGRMGSGSPLHFAVRPAAGHVRFWYHRQENETLETKIQALVEKFKELSDAE